MQASKLSITGSLELNSIQGSASLGCQKEFLDHLVHTLLNFKDNSSA